MLAGFWLHFVGDHRAVDAAVVGDLSCIGAASARSTMSTPIFSSPLALSTSLLDRFGAAQQRHAAAGQNAFFDRRTRGVQGVFDAGLLLLHLGFGLGADRDDRHAAGQLGQPLLELLLVVLALGLVDLVADLLRSRLSMSSRLPAPSTIVRVVLVDRDLLGPAELLERRGSRA